MRCGAPSRIYGKRYQDFLAEVEAKAERVNWLLPPGSGDPSYC